MKVLKWLKSLFVKPKIIVGKSQTANNKPSRKIVRTCYTCGNYDCLNSVGVMCGGIGYKHWQPQTTSHIG